MKKKILILTAMAIFLFLPQASYAQTDLLTNGSFETGDFTGWTVNSTQATNYCTNWLVTTLNGRLCNQTAATPQDGNFVAMNGFDGSGGAITMYQDVTLPAMMSIRLTFQFRINWNIPNPAHQARIFKVQVRDTSNNVLQDVYTFIANSGIPNQTTGWRTEEHNLSQYAGQTIRLYFLEEIPQSFTGPGQMEIDGVKLEAFAPTAALVGIGGRVETPNGYGIRNAFVSFIDSDGQRRSARTNQFGYFRFEDVEVGNTYVFNVSHKRYVFLNSPQVVQVNDRIDKLVFVASP